MKDSTEVKETIIAATTELIEQSGGDVNAITARAIATRSGVALGLINYHFNSKENLIAICVQRIIFSVLLGLANEKNEISDADGLSDQERLTSFAQQTFDFIYSNYALVKISILSDMKDYQPQSNSSYTQKGLKYAIRGNIPESRKRLIAFSLASIMQTAFLAGGNAKEIVGYDLMKKEERDRFLADTVSMLFHGIDEIPATESKGE